ncbi:MAG: response regulator [Elusimicrobia bacterium]|nr:response regulator [Elusimicrobiota bacterium]
MSRNDRDIVILIAEDDDDDYLLTEKAFQEADFAGSLCRVKDGEELMAFLLHKDNSAGLPADGKVLLLLLDLNMPRKDGREALKEIKSHPELRKIPVVVLTTSMAESDIVMSYELGANSLIRKPDSFEQFVDCIKLLRKYWFEVVELPYQRNNRSVS